MSSFISGGPAKDDTHTNFHVNKCLEGCKNTKVQSKIIETCTVDTTNANVLFINDTPSDIFTTPPGLAFINANFSNIANPPFFQFGLPNIYLNIFSTAGVTVSQNSLGFSTVGDSGIWTYNDTESRLFNISGSIAMQGEGVQDETMIGIALFINGSEIPNTNQATWMSINNAASGQLTTTVIQMINPGDEIEIRARDQARRGSNTLELYSCQMTVFSLPLANK